MGGCDFYKQYVGTKSPTEAFKELVDDAIYEYGHGGYSGTIKEKDGYRLLSVPSDVNIQDFMLNVTFLTSPVGECCGECCGDKKTKQQANLYGNGCSEKIILQATPTYAYDTPYTQNMGGLSMEKLSHWQQKGRWIVGWWDGTKQVKITRYKRMVMRFSTTSYQKRSCGR